MQDSTKKYIADEIGDKYKKWTEKDIVKIKAPTGTGKSHFILYELIKRAIDEEKKIFYLVNRLILKNQIKEELKNHVARKLKQEYGGRNIDVNQYVCISTYQSLEKKIKTGRISDLIKKYDDYYFIIYDECHYFYTDSNYNTNTQLSYEFLRNTFKDKVQIFMSATIDEMEIAITNWQTAKLSWREADCTNEYIRSIVERSENRKEEDKYYSVNSDYTYVNIHRFDDINRLREFIRENKEKWLIFTDSKERGISLKKYLINEKQIEKEEIVYIDTDYKEDDDANSTVSEIIEKKQSNKRVIITTAVMDVGISFHDIDLRNIVILADTKSEFIQMLGRKRKDGQKVNVYICKRDLNHFKMRYQYVEKVLNFYDNNKNKFDAMYKRGDGQYREYLLDGYKHLYYKENNDLVYFLFENPRYLNTFNYSYILGIQQDIMDQIMNNSQMYECACKICYFVDGLITVNKFSVERLTNLKYYYLDMIETLESDEDAFLKEQLKWLEKGDDEIKSSLAEMELDYFSSCKKGLEESVKSELKDTMSEDEMQEWKINKGGRKYLEYFYKKSKAYSQNIQEGKYEYGNKKGIPKGLWATDRSIQANEFNICMQCAELPYLMKKESRVYRISGLSSEGDS